MIFHSVGVDQEVIQLDKCMEEIHGVGSCFLCNLEKYKEYVMAVVLHTPIISYGETFKVIHENYSI